ncbi:MAG: RNA methyltransferase [Bacteroidales bacterium]|nr:RNA methyltransferase [Bacteroidales bacterium]
MESLSAAKIKYLSSLSSKKYRDVHGVFVVEGEKMVEEAMKSGFSVLEVYRRDEIGEKAMSRISSLSSPSPVLAVVRKPSDIDSASVPSKGLFLALDSIRDPGNLGTILRIADWFGADGIFASRDTVDIFNPKVVQASMGAIFRVKFHYCDLQAFGEAVLKSGGKLYGTFLDGLDIYSRPLDTGRKNPSAIVMGNESEGISPSMSRLVTGRLYIPPYPKDNPGSESLNVAVATAVTLAEFRRRS